MVMKNKFWPKLFLIIAPVCIVITIISVLYYRHNMNQIKLAENYYNCGDYEEACGSLAFVIESSASEKDLKEKCTVLWGAQSELDSYKEMSKNDTSGSLFFLIKSVYDCDQYITESKTLGYYDQLNKIKSEALQELSKFNMTEEAALKLAHLTPDALDIQAGDYIAYRNTHS